MKKHKLTWRKHETGIRFGPPMQKLWLRVEGMKPVAVATAQAQERSGPWYTYGGGEWGSHWNTYGDCKSLEEARAFAESRVRLTHPAFKPEAEVTK